MQEVKEEERFVFLAKQPSLDFVNTKVMQHGKPVELLEDFGGLVDWLVRSELLPRADADRALELWRERSEGRRLYEKALELRSRLQEMAEALAHGQSVPELSIEAINTAMRHPIGPLELRPASNGFELRRRAELSQPTQLLGPIAQSAAELLSGAEWKLVRRCENPACVLYFLDTSRNRSRRWCSMEGCGNRAKVAAHYRRQRQGRPQGHEAPQGKEAQQPEGKRPRDGKKAR